MMKTILSYGLLFGLVAAMQPVTASAAITDDIRRDWQGQYDAILRDPHTVTATWQKRVPAANLIGAGVYKIAETPDGKLYISDAYEQAPASDVTLAFDGAKLTEYRPLPNRKTNVNVIYDRDFIDQSLAGIYKLNYGFCYSTAGLLINPAAHGKVSPQVLIQHAVGTTTLADGAVKITFRDDDSGLDSPADIVFQKVAGKFTPRQFDYRAQDNLYSIVVDTFTSFPNYSVPARYRYVVNTNSMNDKHQNLSSSTSYKLTIDNNVDERVFTLPPKPEDMTIIVHQGGLAENRVPNVTAPRQNKSGAFLWLLLGAIVCLVAGFWLRRRSLQR